MPALPWVEETKAPGYNSLVTVAKYNHKLLCERKYKALESRWKVRKVLHKQLHNHLANQEEPVSSVLWKLESALDSTTPSSHAYL